jgi:uncharacterized protein
VTTAQLVVVAAAVFSAALIQVLSGFGFALLSVPMMTLAVPTKEAVIVTTLLGSGITTWQAWRGRRTVERVIARRLVLAAYCGMPLGLWVFITVDEDALRLGLGVSVLIAVVLLVAELDLSRAGHSLDYGAGFVSGVLNTSLSTNGPPLVFALQARGLQPDPFRSTINTVFAFCNIVGISLFFLAGKIDRDGLIAAAVALPALLLGQACGYPLRRHVHGERFRRLVLGLLVVAGISAIVNALV